MRAIVIYSTLSGSTMTAAELVSDALKTNGVDAVAVIADPSVKDQIAAFNAVVFASPSWEDNGVDGQPLAEVKQLVQSLTAAHLSGKKIAVFGLGDTSYPHFCGAVTILEGLLNERGVTPVIPSLKIDKYYSSTDNEQKVTDWSVRLAHALQATSA